MSDKRLEEALKKTDELPADWFNVRITNHYYAFDCAHCKEGVHFNRKDHPDEAHWYDETGKFKCLHCGGVTEHVLK